MKQPMQVKTEILVARLNRLSEAAFIRVWRDVIGEVPAAILPRSEMVELLIVSAQHGRAERTG